MPIFEVEQNGETYEVDAPDEASAAAAFAPRTSGPRTRSVINTPARQAHRAALETELEQRQQASADAELNPLERGAGYLMDYGRGIGRALTGTDVDPQAVEGNLGMTIGDAGTTLATGLAAPIVGGVRYAYDKLTGDPDASLRRSIEDSMWAPRTQGGQYVVNLMGAGFKPAADAFHNFGTDMAGAVDFALPGEMSPQTRDDVAAGFEFGPQLALTAAGLPAARGAAADAMRMPPALPAAGVKAAELRAAGYDIAPSQAARLVQRESGRRDMPNVPGHFLESLVNKSELSGRFGTESAKVTEGILRQEFGLPEGTPITAEMLERQLTEANAPYEILVRAVPTVDLSVVQGLIDRLGAVRRENPLLENLPALEKMRARLGETAAGGPLPTQQVLDAIREFRADSRTNFQNITDPVAQQMARGERAAADALEQALEEQARLVDPGLYDQVVAARQRQAKLHNVLDSWSGLEIDPQALARLGESVKLTGGLAQIADAATHLPETVYSTTGTSISKPSNASWMSTPESSVRRFVFEKFVIPKLLSEDFQNRYGTVTPRQPGVPFAPVQPFGDPGVGPQPPPPPPGGRFPRSPAGEGGLSLAPDTDGLPFTSTALEPAIGDIGGLDLASAMLPESPPADAFPFALEGPLDGPAPTPGLPGYGHPELPVAPYRTNPAELRPDVPTEGAIQPYPLDMALVPDGPYDIPPGVESSGVPPPRGPRRPTAGGPDTRAGSLGFAPENGYELPNSIADLLTEPTAALDAGPALPGPLQAIADLVTGTERGGLPVVYNPLQELADALGVDLDPVGPTPPMNPPRGSRGLRAQRDALNKDGPENPAEPSEFEGPTEPAGPRPLADELTLEEGPDRSALPTDFNAIEQTLSEGAVKLGDGKTRSIVIKPFGDRMRIQQTDVAPDMQGRGLNQQNLLDAYDYATERGLPLDSDASFTAAAWGSWKKALREGVIEADPVDISAIDAAMEAGGGVARNPGDKPWITNIRPGPNARR